MAAETRPYDTSEYLADEEAIRLYLAEAFEDGDPSIIAAAIGDVAKARGMTALAQQTGLSRESLYRSFSGEGNPSFATVVKVLDSFGLRLGARSKASVPSNDALVG